MKTGIFFHYQRGERLKDFPEALGDILSKEQVFFYDALYPDKPESAFDLHPIPLEAIYRVHSSEMVGRVMNTGCFEGALYSAAGTFWAARQICFNELTNAFVFTGYGDHHAGRDSFGGGCYLNGAAIAIQEMKSSFKIKRFAIIDTDAHHGDGTWELFQNDQNVLYLCFCGGPFQENNGNVNISVPARLDDDLYIAMVKDALMKKVKPFMPEIVFWNWGYDGTKGDYGDQGLTHRAHFRLAEMIKETAMDVCGGREIVVLCGGSRRDLAAMLIPQVIEILADPMGKAGE